MTPYIPNKLPLTDLDYRLLLPLVGAANRELARYDGLLQGIVNPAVMLSPLTVEEATLSSRLEGTQATVDDVYEHEAGLAHPEREQDIKEVVNYRHALRLGQEQLRVYPITLPFVREIHKILLDSVRGATKEPGKFRLDQNWIGPDKCKIEDASFVPPEPNQLNDHLEDWNRYISGEDIDVLIQTAVMHAQFELLHPFKDGNGRIGRLLIPLFLFQKKALSQPMFYLSSYLESNRDEYYHSLMGISREGNWNGWIAFFLKAIATQAIRNIENVNKIRSLYETMKARIQECTHSQFTIKLLDQIFKRPIFRTTDFVRETKIQRATAINLLRILRDATILKELEPGAGSRPAVMCFPDLLNAAEGKKII